MGSGRRYVLFMVMCITLMLATPAFSESYECVDADTSQMVETLYNTTDMALIYSYTENSTCPYGCNEPSGLCNMDPYGVQAASLYFLFPVASFFFVYMANSLKDEDWAIHLLLIGAAMAMLYIPFGTFASVLSSQFYAPYLLVIVVGTLVIFYYVLKIIVSAINAMRGSKK